MTSTIQTIPTLMNNTLSSPTSDSNDTATTTEFTRKTWGQCQYTFKVVLQGLAGSGKTSLFTRYFSDSFQRGKGHLPTARTQLDSTFVESPLGNSIHLQVWDTVSTEYYTPAAET